MAIDMKNKEIKEFMKNAQLVFMVNFKDNTQHISIGDDVAIGDLVGTPFRMSVHLNNLLEENLRERQAGQAVEQSQEADS